MQGKEAHNDLNDQEFTDFAWSEMSQMLDQEMPVKAGPASDSKKRYGLLFLFLLIGFASGIGTMMVFDQDQQPNVTPIIKPAPVETRPGIVDADDIAQVNTSTAETDQLVELSKNTKRIENKIQSNFNKKNITSSDLTPSKSQKAIDKTRYNNSSSVILFKENPENTKAFSIGNQEDSKSYSGYGANSTSQLIQSEMVENTKAELAARIQVDHLALLDHQEIPFLMTEDKSANPELVGLGVDPKVKFGFYVGAQSRDFNGMHGLSAGFYASSRLDHRFSLRTGLGYNMINGFQANSIGITEPLTPAYFEPIEANLDDYSTVASLQNNQDLPLRSMHYLEMPVALDFHMSKSMSVLMGAKFSYLLSAKTSGYFSNNLNELEVELLDEALYKSMRKMDVATVLGLGFYPTSRVGVEMKYNHGLVDYTRDEKWHIRQLNTNKTFELSLNFLLK